jgi:hypothetical protein
MLCARPLARVLLLVLVAALGVGGVTTAAAASAPISASGTTSTTSCVFANPRTDGGNQVFDATCYETWSGTFVGSDVTQFTLILHANGSGDGVNGVKTFTGTVNGTTGTVTFSSQGHADVAGNFQGNDTIIGGSGGLANLHGSLKAAGSVAAVDTYTGTIQFAGP